MDSWDEIRTAYQVAKAGTVSGAAEALGVHHATVIRHVDSLETNLGVKLFQRHARGYTPTEAGEDLLRVGQATDDQLGQLSGRIRGQGDEVSGELLVTCLQSMSPRLAPVLTSFQKQHPKLTVRLLMDARVFRLEYGEAHIAIRVGSPPEEPDNVVQPFFQEQVGLYAHQSYIDEHGMPNSEADLANHRFVSFDDLGTRAPFYKWLWERVPTERAVYRVGGAPGIYDGIKAGAGLGFVIRTYVEEGDGLVEVMPAKDDWQVPSWLVTHVDLHRTLKVQAFLKHLKEAAVDWQS